MSGIIENINGTSPSEVNIEEPIINFKKCYTCNPRGTLKDHIISQTDEFVFNHDLFRRPLIIITTKKHYHTIYDMPDM